MTTDPTSGVPATSPAPGPTDLTVVAGDGSGTSTTWRLTCDPPGGDHPDAEAACAALAAHGATALPPVPKDQVCTMVYGGPQTATVTGTWRGERISASFSRTNGCEISRWESLAALLPSTAS
ncbi:MAG: SSI family serine proteinase inhibitor [Kineosporiaceae bacterium]